jgi:hypothetical protein
MRNIKNKHMPISLDPGFPYLLAVTAALFAHASFQLGISVLTLLSSHAIGAGKRHTQVFRLDTGYTLGAIVMTAGLLALLVMKIQVIVGQITSLHWAIVSGLLGGAGLAVLLFYYRRNRGTQLWLPRGFVEFASSRAKKTRNGFEAFAIGATMVIAELPFVIAPLLLAALLFQDLPADSQLWAIVGYSVVACLPLLVMTVLISSGHKISSVQRWRETNKTFLQWTSGLVLILLGIYIYGLYVWGGIR